MTPISINSMYIFMACAFPLFAADLLEARSIPVG